MRTITLELLRHGPAHNQLLSPLTEYLALCENHSAVSIRVPFEHHQMAYRLRALCYFLGQESRNFQLTDTARVIGDMLAQIPGLTADLSRQDPNTENSAASITHVRLILSSSELALLPFELALAPNGFPGAGQYLSLQPQTPICITRETRRHPRQFLKWPTRPKILFVFASPPGFESVPAPAHLLALRKAISPWLSFSDDLGEQTQSDHNEETARSHAREVRERLVVLPFATVAMLEQACASGQFTHIHILAHGAQLASEYDTRYGLALHKADDAAGHEIVSGERLATILNARVGKSDETGHLAVVTLASCNSGNVGSVAGVGASVSHALHAAGIPLVIGSQFPLSFGGSVIMVEKLYDGLLWGDDPRELLVDLRRSLHSNYSETHDWASLTAYSSLPHNFDAQLVNIRITQAKRSINAALRQADDVLQRFLPTENDLHDDDAGIVQPMASDDSKARECAALAHIKKAQNPLKKLLKQHPASREQIQAKLAGVHKRVAQLQFHVHHSSHEFDPATWDAICEELHRSRKHYWETRFLEPTEAYKTVQYLALTLILQAMKRLLPSDLRPERSPLQLWLAAEIQAISASESGSDANRSWAWCDLAELYLMAPMVEGLDTLRMAQLQAGGPAIGPSSVQNLGEAPERAGNAAIFAYFGEMAVHAASQITRLASRSSYQNFSTRRQIARYLIWFLPMLAIHGDAGESRFSRDIRRHLTRTAKNMLNVMPPGEEPAWDEHL